MDFREQYHRQFSDLPEEDRPPRTPDCAPDDVLVRCGEPGELIPVQYVLDGAMLRKPDNLHRMLGARYVLVAVRGDEEDVVGTLVRTPPDRSLDRHLLADAMKRAADPPADPETWGQGHEPTHVDAVAVKYPHRGEGIGRALVESAVERTDGPLTVAFDDDVRPFYEALDFEIWQTRPGVRNRLVGWKE